MLNNPLVSHFVRLDTVVTTVDAVNGLRHLGEHTEAVKQAALADRLLLTKTDLATPETIENLRRQLVVLNPGATHSVVTNGEIAPETLFGAALFDPARKTVDARRWINEEAYESPRHHHGGHDDHRDHHHHHDHHHGIHAFCLTSEQPLAWAAFSAWLGRLRNGAGDDLLRVKGILNLIGESAPVVVHGVHHIFHPPVVLDAWPDSDHRSKIVFIARGIERSELEASFLEHVAGRSALLRQEAG
jgi:G3E family GTPase